MNEWLYENFGVLQYMLVLQELHKQGYQKLRWFSYMAPNGCAMRCHITTQGNIYRNLEIKQLDKEHAWYVSTSQADSKMVNVTPYVDEFKQEMSAFLDEGKGSDRDYVAWFDAVVGEAKKGLLPSFNDECWDAPLGKIRVGERLYPCPPITEPDLEEQVVVIKGDITILRVDAIVNAANTSLLGGDGVDGAIHHAAGPELLAECRTLNGCMTGQSKVTNGYNLPCSKVIHTVGPVWRGGKHNEDYLLASCYRTALDIAAERRLSSVAFPCISTGVYHFPQKRAAQIAIDVIKDYILTGKYKGYVIICCFQKDDAEIYQSILSQH